MPKVSSIVLVVLLALTAARALMMEFIREPFEPSPTSVAAPIAPGPGVILLLNTLTLACGAVLAWGRLFRGHAESNLGHLSKTALAALVCLMAVSLLSLLSVFWASDQFHALVSASTFIAAAVSVCCFASLAKHPGVLRISAAVLIAIMAAQVTQGIVYRVLDLPGLQEGWKTQRESFFAERGWQPDSFLARQFEQKIMRGELVGFSASANTYAATLVLGGLLAAGVLAGSVLKRQWPRVAAMGTVLLAAIAIGLFTYSRTAAITALLGSGLIGLGICAPRLLSVHRRKLLVGLAAALLLGTAALVAVGMSRGNLFHPSLTFRWFYWNGAAAMLAENPALGVGYGNFGPHYLKHRLPQASEEVKDPHNMLVRLAAELGPAGALLMLGAMVLTAISATRQGNDTLKHEQPNPFTFPTVRLPAFAVALATGMILFLAVDFSAGFDYALYECLRRLLFAGVMLIVALAVCIKSAESWEIEPSSLHSLHAAMLTCLAMAWLANMLDFSFFETGFMLQVSVAWGVCLGVSRLSSSSSAIPSKRIALRLPLALCATGLTLASLAGTVLVANAESQSRTGDQLVRASRLAEASQAYFSAYNQLPINSENALKLGRALAMAGADENRLRSAARLAMDADPMNIDAILFAAAVERAAAQRTLDANGRASFLAAIKFQQKAVALNPNAVSLRLRLAEDFALEGARSMAAQEMIDALTSNNALLPDEPKRLSSDEIKKINQRIDELLR